jgi:hypothetical protein
MARKLLLCKAIAGSFPRENDLREDAMSETRFSELNRANSHLPQEIVERYFYCRLAVVQMEPRESTEEAWGRHLADHPGDVYANIKVFNRPAVSIF